MTLTRFLAGVGFNSQRDGILLNVRREESLKIFGFNSQRDGILRWMPESLANWIDEFQFPTGWNSTSFQL